MIRQWLGTQKLTSNSKYIKSTQLSAISEQFWNGKNESKIQIQSKWYRRVPNEWLSCYKNYLCVSAPRIECLLLSDSGVPELLFPLEAIEISKIIKLAEYLRFLITSCL